jgi:predicted metal-binding membrane protein
MRRPAVFALVYLLVWIGSSLFAAISQNGLEQAALLPCMLASASPTRRNIFYRGRPLSLVTIEADLPPQVSMPTGVILFRWRSGIVGALRMGLEHGAYCLGCC